MMMGSVLKEVREAMCLSTSPSVCSPNEEMFEALFKGVSTQLGPRTMEKCFLRKSACHLLFILPKSSFGMGKMGHQMTSDDVSVELTR
jgi:hypothetical protein